MKRAQEAEAQNGCAWKFSGAAGYDLFCLILEIYL
jgi:hypothetical protein